MCEERGTRVVSVAHRGVGSAMLAPTALRDSCVMLMGCGPANHPPGEELMLTTAEILACIRDGDLALETDQMSMVDVKAAWLRASEPGRSIVLTLD